MKKKAERDIEKNYPLNEFVAKIRRLADDLESGKAFSIQVAGERIRVPGKATINIEHERGDSEEELEFQLVWKVGSAAKNIAKKASIKRAVSKTVVRSKRRGK